MGILLRRPEMSGSFPPTIEANPSASLEPARSSLRGPLAEAQAEGAATRHGQIQKMLDFLHSNPVTGEAYGENVTPRKLLDIKRGLSDEHLRWNPDIHDQTVRAGRQAYRALDKELDRLVPESAPINQRVFSLLEVLRNAERETRTAGTGQRVMGRFAAHTGALTGAGLGGAMGYREGGIPGAIAGTIGGAVIPELIASPEGQMGTARLFHSAKNLRPGVAALAQIGRRNP